MTLVPPRSLVTNYTELINRTETIVLARAIRESKGTIATRDGNLPIAGFELVEALKGSSPQVFSIPNGALVKEEKSPKGDFNGHRNLAFWNDNITRQWNASDGKMRPVFLEGHSYLLFLDNPHWHSYEEIKETNDLWLTTVRKVIENPALETGITLSTKEWLSMAQGIFLGTVNDEVGPTLRVDDVLTGDFGRTWKETKGTVLDREIVSGIPLGKEFLVISYQREPGQPLYSSGKLFPLQDGRIDFQDAIARSKITVQGKSSFSIDELKALFR
ncbi:hypothetical protein ACTL6U_16085 [Rhodovibrionaceae bacterium A322]